MKIKPEHVSIMKCAIAPHAEALRNLREIRKIDQRVKDVEKCLRWDAIGMAKLTMFLCDAIYPYANDDHIDTAMRRIFADLSI